MTDFPALPASPFLLSHLLGLLFMLHLLFMNFVLAAPLLTLMFLWSKRSTGRLFARWLAAPLPVAFTFAINFGVASLLFMQVLYPQRFFTANILLGSRWLAIIAMLMAAFYGSYLLLRALKADSGRVVPTLFGLPVLLLTCGIAVIMIANYYLTTADEQWPHLLHQPWRVLAESTFLPRALHILFGSIAVSGFWMIWIAAWRQRKGTALDAIHEFRKQGLLIAAGGTCAQIIIGVWFLIWLPATAWDRLFSGSFPGLVWISGVAAGLVLLGILIVANVFPERTLWRKLATGLLLWTVGGMVAGRDVIRHAAFDPKFSIEYLPVQPQKEAIWVFGIVLLLGVLTVAWLLSLLWRRPAGSD